MLDPILLDIPLELRSPRLLLRLPCAGDGVMVCPSVRESLPELKPWMPWATDAYSVEDGELWCRRAIANFWTRTQLTYLIFDHEQRRHLGNINAFRVDWKLPRCEIGYWLRTDAWGRGFMSEAVDALLAMLEAYLKPIRIEIACDDLNARSVNVALRCGFSLDGTMRQDFRYPDNRLRSTRVYSRIAPP